MADLDRCDRPATVEIVARVERSHGKPYAGRVLVADVVHVFRCGHHLLGHHGMSYPKNAKERPLKRGIAEAIA